MIGSYVILETEAAYFAKKICGDMTVWNILIPQMDGEDVDCSAGVVGEVSEHFDFTVESNLTLN